MTLSGVIARGALADLAVTCRLLSWGSSDLRALTVSDRLGPSGFASVTKYCTNTSNDIISFLSCQISSLNVGNLLFFGLIFVLSALLSADQFNTNKLRPFLHSYYMCLVKTVDVMWKRIVKTAPYQNLSEFGWITKKLYDDQSCPNLPATPCTGPISKFQTPFDSSVRELHVQGKKIWTGDHEWRHRSGQSQNFRLFGLGDIAE